MSSLKTDLPNKNRIFYANVGIKSVNLACGLSHEDHKDDRLPSSLCFNP